MKEVYPEDSRVPMTLCWIQTYGSVLNRTLLFTSVLKRSVPVELSLRGAFAARYGINAHCPVRSPIIAAGVSQL